MSIDEFEKQQEEKKKQQRTGPRPEEISFQAILEGKPLPKIVPSKKKPVEEDEDLPGSIFSIDMQDDFSKYKQKDRFGLESQESKPIALP